MDEFPGSYITLPMVKTENIQMVTHEPKENQATRQVSLNHVVMV